MCLFMCHRIDEMLDGRYLFLYVVLVTYDDDCRKDRYSPKQRNRFFKLAH